MTDELVLTSLNPPRPYATCSHIHIAPSPRPHSSRSHAHRYFGFPVSVFSLSLYRHPFLYTLFCPRFTLIINNNNREHNRGQCHFRSTVFSSQLEQWKHPGETFVLTCHLGCRWGYHLVWITCSSIAFVDFSFVDLVFSLGCF
jgi:hypothetical protein